MNPDEINTKLALGAIDESGVFPHLDRLRRAPLVFDIDFGLTRLPEEPGMIMIRGARQYGKSTWLEQQLYDTVSTFGPGTAYYLNGETIANAAQLEQDIDYLLPSFAKNARVRRIFIDEITAISEWELILKRMADQGKLVDVLVITTGSRATDLRRGFEKLPGRKGKLQRSAYLFTPIAYREFKRVCGDLLQGSTLVAYLMSGGSPIACSELALQHRLPDYVIELTRDWIEGEVAHAGRYRSALLNVMNVIFRFGGTAVGQAKLARETGLANNTIAAGYIELLNDLGCVTPAYPWDADRQMLILRKPCKYHFTNLLAAVSYDKNRMRTPEDFYALPETTQAEWYEWLVAQELTRRAAIQGQHILAPLAFWQTKEHEIDFVDYRGHYIEVKRGQSTPIEFNWFASQLRQHQLTVINARQFDTERIHGVTLEAFLLDDGV